MGLGRADMATSILSLAGEPAPFSRKYAGQDSKTMHRMSQRLRGYFIFREEVLGTADDPKETEDDGQTCTAELPVDGSVVVQVFDRGFDPFSLREVGFLKCWVVANK